MNIKFLFNLVVYCWLQKYCLVRKFISISKEESLMGLKINAIYAGIISALVLTGVGLGVYFGVFYEKTPNGTESTVLTIQGSLSTSNYTLEEIKTFSSASGFATYRRSTGSIEDLFHFTGAVFPPDTVDTGIFSPEYEVEVLASDGYKVVFTYDMLLGHFPAYDNETGEYIGIGNFSVILAYEKNGENLPPEDGTLRIALLPEEGESYISDSSPWIKDVVRINIVPVSSWITYLFGITNDSIDRNTFEAYMHFNEGEDRQIYQLQEGDRLNTYEGLSLWRLLAIIDGGPTDSFNDTLAATGYSIILKNSLEESVIFDSIDVARNDSYILAALKNSVFLSGSDAPLRLVGSGVSSLEMLGGIIEIRLVF